MRVYETTFIVNPQTDDATIDEQVAAVSDLIGRHGGKVLHEDRMGTRRLAYPIKKLTQGYYHTFIFQANETFLPELDKYYQFNEAYLRHLTIKFEGDPETLQKREAQAPTAEVPKPAERRAEEPKPEKADEPEEVLVAQSVPPSEETAEVEESTEEASSEEESPEAEEAEKANVAGEAATSEDEADEAEEEKKES